MQLSCQRCLACLRLPLHNQRYLLRGLRVPVDDPCRWAHAVRVGEISEDMKIAEVERRLIAKFPQFTPDEVSRIIASAHARFERRPIRDFVPLFVERNAAYRLDKLRSLSPTQ